MTVEAFAWRSLESSSTGCKYPWTSPTWICAVWNVLLSLPVHAEDPRLGMGEDTQTITSKMLSLGTRLPSVRSFLFALVASIACSRGVVELDLALAEVEVGDPSTS